MHRLGGWLGLAAALAAAAWLVASPHLAARELGRALESGDPVALEQRVDFPRLRESLKAQLSAAMLEEAGGAAENPLGAVVMGLASVLVDGLVNAAVTPSGLAGMAKGRIPPTPGGPPREPGAAEPRDFFEGARATRDALDRFSLWVPEEGGGEIRFVLSLQGVSWRLTQVVLPLG